jgi:hypothetical protein
MKGKCCCFLLPLSSSMTRCSVVLHAKVCTSLVLGVVATDSASEATLLIAPSMRVLVGFGLAACWRFSGSAP